MAQTKAPTTPPKKTDFSYLKSYEETDTKIYGTVKIEGRQTYVYLYRKDDINSPSTFILNKGARFELLNMTPVKGFQRILVKVLSNPSDNKFVDTVGWLKVSNTTLNKFFDTQKNLIDTSFLYNKYLNAAAKAREDAKKTTCPTNKTCYQAWAEYYDCQVKYSRSESEPDCPLVNCAIEDCPGDTFGNTSPH